MSYHWWDKGTTMPVRCRWPPQWRSPCCDAGRGGRGRADPVHAAWGWRSDPETGCWESCRDGGGGRGRSCLPRKRSGAPSGANRRRLRPSDAARARGETKMRTRRMLKTSRRSHHPAPRCRHRTWTCRPGLKPERRLSSGKKTMMTTRSFCD